MNAEQLARSIGETPSCSCGCERCGRDIHDLYRAVLDYAAWTKNVEAAHPIPVRIPCPECGELHIDEGEFATKPHHTHSCQHCGLTWRPAVVHTVGVRFLPGFRDRPDAEALLPPGPATKELPP